MSVPTRKEFTKTDLNQLNWNLFSRIEKSTPPPPPPPTPPLRKGLQS